MANSIEILESSVKGSTAVVNKLRKDGFNDNQILAMVLMVRYSCGDEGVDYFCRNSAISKYGLADFCKEVEWECTPRRFASICGSISRKIKETELDYIKYISLDDKDIPSDARRQFNLSIKVFKVFEPK